MDDERSSTGSRSPDGRRAQSVSSLYASHSHSTIVSAIQRDERCKLEQLKYLKRVAKLRESILDRSFLVDNVNDLRNAKNLKNLRNFFHRKYGPVEDCFLAARRTAATEKSPCRTSHPPARILFRFKNDAMRVLDGKRRRLLIPYPKQECRDDSGMITLTKSRPYENMIKNGLEASVVELTANSLALGYYFPKENCINSTAVPWNGRGSNDEEWLEEFQSKECVIVRIDSVKRTIELEVPRHGDSSTWFDFRNGKDYATIRFKEIFGFIDLCRCDGNNNNETEQYSLLLALKHPPKFHSDTPSIGLGFAVVEQDLERQRCLSFGSIHASAFGRCFGLKLDVTESSIERLLLCKGLKKLREFGMIRSDLHSVEEARCISTIHIGKRRRHCKDGTSGIA